jgi:nucleotide-binding universal stress UspA family protein
MLLFAGMSAETMSGGTLASNVQQQFFEQLQQLWEQSGGRDGEAELHVEVGHAAARIVDFAVERGDDLIVLASQGRSGVERFLIGSVAERIARAAECPVMTFKADFAGPAARFAAREAEPSSRPSKAVN